jgi:phosphotransferase system HPr (HPr) family protein
MQYSDSICSILVVLEEQATLYMRPAAMLAKIANQFESDVVLEHGNARANGKSLLDIITLGISSGAGFRVFASGKDASNAIRTIKVFFERFFIDGEISDVISNEHAVSDKCLNIQHIEGEDVKQKKQAAIKQQETQVKQVAQAKKKAQSFMWPLSGKVNEVLLAGDFNNWKPEPMSKREKEFHASMKLEPGVYQYKFVVDGQWQVDPYAKENTQNDFGTVNSVLQVD